MNKLTFSILLVGLFAAAVLARTSPQVRRPFTFTPGQTYIYEYRGRQWNGLTKLADQYSGLTIDCDVILKAQQNGQEVLMKLDDVKVEQLHTQAIDSNDIRKLNPGQEVNSRQMTLFRDELSKPIRFTYVDGKVLRFVAEASDAEWSINIKKSILSLFQLDLAPSKIIKSSSKQQIESITGTDAEDMIRDAQDMPLVYPIYEESFGGICETLYEVDSIDNVEKRGQQEYEQFADVLNVTKTVNYKNCLTDPSVSYDRHSFKVNTQTTKGKLFSQQPTVASAQFYPVPEELKQKYSNVYNSLDKQDNVASPVPVERQSFTKYNISTSPKTLVDRRSSILATQDDMSIIESIYSEGKIKYETESDLLVSATQQTLKLVACAPTGELARVAPEYSALQIVSVNQPAVEYQTIQCELNAQKVKFYQAMWKFAQMQSAYKTGGAQSPLGVSSPLYSHKMALPFALSASWYPIVATGTLSPEQSVENLVNPDQLAKAYENLLIGLAEDVLTEDVAQSKRAGEKVVRLTNIVAFMPKHKLVDVYERIVERIQQAKQQQAASRGKQAIVDNSEVAKWKIVRKLCLDSLPMAGSKQAIEMIEMLIQNNRVKPYEAKELCEAVPANLRYPDTEIIDAFIRISQLPQVRKNRSLFASCSIAVGKMIAGAYAKSKDASYKPTTYEQANKLPINLRNDDIIRQVIDEADPRRQLPINWDSSEQQQLYERLVLDEQDLIKYVKLYKQMLNKASTYHDKVIYLETLAHMKVPQVLPILEPFVTGRLSLAQCLGSQPMDIDRPVEPSQWYNRQKRMTAIKRQQNIDAADMTVSQQQTDKDWTEQEAYGAEECNYMRTIAIYALAHVARWSPNKVQALLLPVFDNTYEPYQIRIAAFTTMTLTKIDEHVLERIASQMWREPNKEVASFVVGTIDTISKMTSPLAGPYKYAAQKAASAMPKQYLDTWKFSWMAGGDHFNHQKQSGMSWIAEIVKSNVSSIPRAAYFHVGHQHGPGGTKYDNQVELGFTSKGIESLIKQYIEFNKQQTDETNIVASVLENLYDAKDDLVKYYYEARDQIKSSILDDQKETTTSEPFVQNFYFKRQQPIDGVNSRAGKQSRQASDLFEGMNSRSKRSVTIQARSSQDDDEEAKLTLFTKMFDQTSYHALDKKQILDTLEKFDDYVKMAADELIKGGKLHYVKMMMPSNMWHVVPSQLGLPVVVTHRRPIVASIKVDGAPNGQLTSNKVSQYIRQQATGQQVPNVVGHNFATAEGLNITAIVHPKIMHSNINFIFAVEQANNEAYGVTTEKSHALSLPLEVSVAFSSPKQLVSFAIEPKTPNRMLWTKEVAKTFIGKLSIAGPTPDNWLGKEHLVRVPSQQAQYKRTERGAHFVPSLLTSVQDLINEPKEQQKKAIEELETPYKFEHRFVQDILGLEINMDGASDDENVVRSMNKPDLSKSARGQLHWTSTDEIDDLSQHSKSGPFGDKLHFIESANTRPSKYLEFYATIKPDQPHKSPIYRFDFVLDGKTSSQNFKLNQQRQQDAIRQIGVKSRPMNRLDMQSAKMWETIEQNKKMNQISQQQNMLEAY